MPAGIDDLLVAECFAQFYGSAAEQQSVANNSQTSMTGAGSSVISMSEYTGVLKRWRGLVVALTLCGALLGSVLIMLQPGAYVSRAIVQVRPIVVQSDDPNLDATRQVSPETEVEVARSERVAERALALRLAADQLEIDDLASEDVRLAAKAIPVDDADVRSDRQSVTVSVVSDTEILAFEAAGDSPAEARDLAQSFAIAYLDFRRDEAISGRLESRQRLADREAEVVTELETAAGSRFAPADLPPDSLAYADISKRQELTVIGTKFANLDALAVDPGVVLTDANVPMAQEGLPSLSGPVIGALLGLLSALTAAFVLDRSDDRLRSGRTELGALGVPLLGTAPVVRKKLAKGATSRLYPINTPGSDAYRRLQGSLLFNLDSEAKTVVLVAGVLSADSATGVAANISATAARAGRRTLLVGADLRNDRLGAEFGIEPTTGLSDVILDGARLAESITPVVDLDHLGVLSAGTHLDRPADVLQSQAFARLMAAVRADFDLVVVEAPPVLRVADAVDIAGLCDGSIVVVDEGSESRQAIVESVDQLRGVGSDVVGVVVASAAQPDN